jgi:hypothetical protein
VLPFSLGAANDENRFAAGLETGRVQVCAIVLVLLQPEGVLSMGVRLDGICREYFRPSPCALRFLAILQASQSGYLTMPCAARYASRGPCARPSRLFIDHNFLSHSLAEQSQSGIAQCRNSQH